MRKSIFDKLNLRPGERRLVIIVGIIVFLIVNAIFVWPQFSEWGKLKARRTTAEILKQQYEREIRNTKTYVERLKELEEKGVGVLPEDQALKLANTVANQTALSGVQMNRWDPTRTTTFSASGKTNQFFEEQSGTLNFIAEERNLVDFLYNLGAGGSMVRARTMTLNPDGPRNKLQGTMMLVASYQKKAPPKVVPAAAAPATAGAKPVASNAAARPASPFARTNAPPAPAKTNIAGKK